MASKMAVRHMLCYNLYITDRVKPSEIIHFLFQMPINVDCLEICLSLLKLFLLQIFNMLYITVETLTGLNIQ